VLALVFRARVRARVQEAEDAPDNANYAPNDGQADIPDHLSYNLYLI